MTEPWSSHLVQLLAAYLEQARAVAEKRALQVRRDAALHLGIAQPVGVLSGAALEARAEVSQHGLCEGGGL